MKRIICLLLCLMLVTGLTATVWAEDYFIDLGQTWDSDILAGGIYDLYAWVGENADDYTYQWQVDVGFGEVAGPIWRTMPIPTATAAPKPTICS